MGFPPWIFKGLVLGTWRFLYFLLLKRDQQQTDDLLEDLVEAQCF